MDKWDRMGRDKDPWMAVFINQPVHWRTPGGAVWGYLNEGCVRGEPDGK